MQRPRAARRPSVRPGDGAGRESGRASAISTSTCPSACTAAATATSSPPSGALDEHGAVRRRAPGRARAGAWRLAARSRRCSSAAGTPTFTEPAALARVLAALPDGGEVTVEANPETVTPTLARCSASTGVTRVSLGAQSFRPHLLEVLERVPDPDDVRRAVHTLRDAGFDNISLDLIYGIPGQSPADLDGGPRGRARARARAPLLLRARGEARNAVHPCDGEELARQAEAMEGYFERVVDDADRRRLPLVRDGELLPATATATSAHATTWGTGAAHDYLGVGIGAVSTLGGVRRRNRPSLARYVGRARARRGAAARGRAARRRDAGGRAAHARAPARRAPRARRARATVVDARGARAARRRAGSSSAVDGGIRLTQRGRLLGGARHGRAAPSPRRHAERVDRAHGYHRDGAHAAKARDPAAGRRGVRRDRSAGRLEGARRAAGTRRVVVDGARASWPSSRRSACSPTRTPRRAASRRRAATASTPRSSSGAIEGRPGPFPLDLRRCGTSSRRRCAGRPRRSPRRRICWRSCRRRRSRRPPVRHVEVLQLQPRVVIVVVITASGGVSKRVFESEEPSTPDSSSGRVRTSTRRSSACARRRRRAARVRGPGALRPRAAVSRDRPAGVRRPRRGAATRALRRRRRGLLGDAQRRRARGLPAPARGAGAARRGARAAVGRARPASGPVSASGRSSRARSCTARPTSARRTASRTARSARSACSARCGWTTRRRSARCARPRSSCRGWSKRSTSGEPDGDAEQDYYELLGVARDASDAEIKRRSGASRASSTRRERRAGRGAERFRAVAEAYEVLSDPERRQDLRPLRPRGPAGRRIPPIEFDLGSLSDVFAAFFGESLFGDGGCDGPRPARGPDVAAQVEIDLADVVSGTTLDVPRPCRARPASACAGTGAAPGTSPITCPACGGRRARPAGLAERSSGRWSARARAHAATARAAIVETPCERCDGDGRTIEDVPLELDVPAGHPRRPADPRAARRARRRARRATG